jgi:glycosyltransferase involved in cell wall biosynthesis
MNISLAMIVKNEEGILGDCLTSVRDLVDEMIVVDTGSTDYTKLIAHSTGAKVFDFPWCDDFAKARNQSLSYCNSDWILVLDADEALNPADHEKVKSAIESDVVAFNLPIWNYLPHKEIVVMDKSPMDNPNFGKEVIGGNFSCYAQHEGMRLFRNTHEDVFVGRIHETPDDYFNARHSKIADLNVVIHHAGKMQFVREDSKRDYYLTLALEDAKENPDNARSWFNVFQQALVGDKPEVVLKAAKEYMRIHNGCASPIIFIGSGIALRELGRVQDSLACFDAVLKLDPLNVVALAQKEVSVGKIKIKETSQP